MIDLDAASVLLQWATGGLFFLWVTGRRREVGIGYGWTMRITFGLMAAGAVVVGFLVDTEPVREVAGMGVVVATTAAMVVSVVRLWMCLKASRPVSPRCSNYLRYILPHTSGRLR